MKPPDLRDALKVRWLKLFPFTSLIGYTLYLSHYILWLFWFFFALGFFIFTTMVEICIECYSSKKSLSGLILAR